MCLVYRFLSVWAALTLTFVLMRVLPGDAITSQLVEIGADPIIVAERREALGLDKPLLTQYGEYLLQIVQGDWGRSLIRGLPVSSLIAEAMPHTFSLALASLLFATIFGVSLGMIAALQTGRIGSTIAQFISTLSLSIPIYWSATIAILLFSVHLNWFPASGVGSTEHLILPVTLLGFHAAGAVSLITYTSITQTLAMNFVRAAYAKGLPPFQILTRHVLRASLPPIITVIALQAGFLLGGTVIIERIFVRPGLGRVLLDAVLSRDYSVVQAVVALSAVLYAIANTLADIIHHLLDPRLRFKSL
jgi:ABC-type dipeptide/oligopeptide/nickel transport system permease component